MKWHVQPDADFLKQAGSASPMSFDSWYLARAAYVGLCAGRYLVIGKNAGLDIMMLSGGDPGIPDLVHLDSGDTVPEYVFVTMCNSYSGVIRNECIGIHQKIRCID